MGIACADHGLSKPRDLDGGWLNSDPMEQAFGVAAHEPGL
jgi:hypothetical protein